MKKSHLTKRMFSLVLSLLMVVTMLPTFAITAFADGTEHFLMAYFTGNLQTEQQIRFAISDDGANFKPLYGGNGVLQEKSTDTYADGTYRNTDGLRDPYIFDGQDGYYYCIATDLEATAYTFSGNQSQMVVWRSADLINWSDAYYINVAQIINHNEGTSYNNNDFARTWAPEVYVENGTFMVYFALRSNAYVGDDSTTLYYMTTDNLMDWTHYSTPVSLYDPGYDSIDGDIVKQNGVYYMFYKDETPGRNTVCLATASAMNGPYSYVGQFTTSSDTGALEGCEVYKVGSDYYLVADRYGAAGNFAIYNLGPSLAAVAAKGSTISVTDGNPITTVEELYGFTNLTPRHGSIVPITTAQYNALCEASGGVTDTDIMYNFTTWHDITNNALDYRVYNDSSLHKVYIQTNGYSRVNHDSGYIMLNNSNMFFNQQSPEVVDMFPDDVYTVSFDYSLESTTNLAAPIFAISSNTQDYVMIFGNGDCWVCKSGESDDTEVCSTGNLTLGVTYHYDVVSDGTNIIFYRDGEKIGSVAATVDFPTSGTRYAAFGFTDDHSSAGRGYGSYSHIRFRDSAVSADTLLSEYSGNNKIVYTKAGGSDSYNGRGSVLNVSNEGNHSLIEPFVSHNASSYTIAGWVNPGATINNNVILGVGTGFRRAWPYGRYLAFFENGNILFNYCSGSGNSASGVSGNYSEHFVDLNSTFTLTANEWSYLQINITPVSYNQVKLSIWKNGVLSYQNDISLTTKVGGSNVNGNDYAYGMLGFMQLPTNSMLLGNMSEPNWYQVADDTSYVQDVRVYTQAMDPAALYAAEAGEQELTSNYTKLYTTPTFNAVAYHTTDPAHRTDSSGNILEVGKGYNNVAYCTYDGTSFTTCAYNTSGTRNQSDGDTGTIWTLRYKMPLPKDIVLVYDGVAENKPAAPVEAEFWASGGWTKLGELYFQGTDIEGTNKEKFLLNDYWYGFEGDWTKWPGKTYDESNYSNKSSDWRGKFSGKDTIFFETRHDGSGHNRAWNRLNYEGSGDSVNYYEKYENIYFGVYSTNSGNSYGNWTREHLQNEDNRIYVLNYKPVYDIVNGTTKVNIGGTNYTASQLYTYFITNIEPNKWMYTEESIDQYYKVMYAIMHANPNDYEFGGTSNSAANTESDVQKCSKNIRIAAEEFTQIKFVKKTFDVKYNRASGFSSETVTAGNNLANAPSQSPAVYSENLTHTTFSWVNDNAPSNSHMPTSDEIYTEEGLTAACNTSGSTHIDAQGDTNGWTEHECSVCNHNDPANNVWDSHTSDWTAYNTKANSTASILADPSYASTYTTSSKATFESEVAAAKSGVTPNDETKSASYITTRTTALANAERKLNHVADFSTLDTNVSTSASAKSSGTTYTYSTFVPFANAYNAANDIKTNTSGDYVRANTPMYATDGSGYVTGTLSAEQDAITSAANTLGTTYGALATADTTENYATFDYANTVASSVDSEKYKNSAFTTFTNAKTTAYNAAYHTLADATEANNYNTLAGTSLSAGDKVKDSAHVDALTNDLMTAITNLNTSGVKQLWVTLTVEDDTTGTQIGDTVRTNVNYGELYTATLPAAASGKNVDKWSISYYSYNDNHEGETAVSSSKISSVENTLTRAVHNNMAIVAAVSDAAGAADTKKIVVKDMYKNVTDIFYVASNTSIPSSADVLGEKKLTIGSHEVSVKDVPFYSFDKWTLSSDDTNNVYTYTPVYTTSKKCSFSFIGATTSSKNVDFDRRVDIVYDSSIETAVKTTAGVSNAEFVAWAVQTTSGKYQIASYNSNYTFYSVVDESFVPIMNIGTSGDPTYVAVTSSSGAVSGELTAGDIDSSIPTIDATNFTPNQLLKYKLKNKCPFIHVQEVKVQGSRARAYCRVSTGAEHVGGYGVIIKNDSTDDSFTQYTLKKTVTNILSTGQFTYTLNNKYGASAGEDAGKPKNFTAPIAFRGFVTYDVSYTAAGKTTNINVSEYSNGDHDANA